MCSEFDHIRILCIGNPPWFTLQKIDFLFSEMLLLQFFFIGCFGCTHLLVGNINTDDIDDVLSYFVVVVCISELID